MWRAIGMLAICGLLCLLPAGVTAAAPLPVGPSDTERICGFHLPLPDGWSETKREDGFIYYGNRKLLTLARVTRFAEAIGADYAIEPMMRRAMGIVFASYRADSLVWLDHFAGEARIIYYFVFVNNVVIGDRTLVGYSLQFFVLDQKPIGDLSPRGWWAAFVSFWVPQAEFRGMEATFIDMVKRFEFIKPEGVC